MSKTTTTRSVCLSTELLDRITAHLAALISDQGDLKAGLKADRRGWLEEAIREKLARDVPRRPGARGPQGRPDVPRPQDVPRAPEVPPVMSTGGTQATSLYEDFEGVRIRVGAPKPRAGYVHWRSRRHMVAEALEIDIPAEVIHHADLMTQNLKPTTLGWKHTEKLIVQVREAESKKVAPDKLWQKWMPAGGSVALSGAT
jgi:hypothetical protein